MALNNSGNNNTSSSSSGYDGRIRSLPRNKNGPYICSKCMSELASPQKFASHVRCVHYKDETEVDRRKRVMATKSWKSRDLQLATVNQAVVTAVRRDISAEFASAAGNNVAAPCPPAMVKVESVALANGVHEPVYALAPPPGMALKLDAGVKIKEETPDAGVRIKEETPDDGVSIKEETL